jgi:hypothetical protein
MKENQPAQSELLPPPSFPPEEIWVLGAGHFGYLAASRLRQRYPKAPMLVVDQRDQKLVPIREELEVKTETADAVSFLARHTPSDPVWLIPAVPVHLAFEWFLFRLRETAAAHPIPVPKTVDWMVPNPYRLSDETLYASFATFICPDTCSEPDEICTHTRSPRQGNLFERLGGIRLAGFEVTVARSWQLAPGVGGYTAGYLRSVLEGIKRTPGVHLIATSCRCHGVISGLKWG